MRKKLLTLLLVLSLLLAMCPAGLAAEARETDFFTDQPHADVNYADMTYEHLEAAPFLEEMEAIRALLSSGSNAKAVEERFDALTDRVLYLVTMYRLIDIRTYQNATDETAAAELEHTYEVYLDVSDALCLLVRAILESPCAGFLKPQLSEEDQAYYLDYEAMSAEEKALESQEQALTNEYTAAAARITAEVDGQEWDDASAYYAYMDGLIAYEDYVEIADAVAREQNRVLGEIYLRMVALRKQIAQVQGYDSYTAYAYENIYQRDYSPEEIQRFHASVKEHIAPLFSDLLTLWQGEGSSEAFYQDYTGDAALDMIEPYIGQLSSEMAEAFAYMRSHGLYDTGESSAKADAGFTTILDYYGAPFFFNAPSGNVYDLTTAVHEFGHYNNYYWQSCGWNDSSKSIDLCEVHSQGLELLFSHFYPELFGQDGDAVLNYQLLTITGAIREGALHDELQQYVYATDNVTLEQINREYRRLCGEYGLVEADDPREMLYDWAQVPHTFTSPCYYISYAVSAAGAFAFWLDAQEGTYFDALDDYLAFVALPADMSFQESFQALQMDSPLSETYLEELTGTLRTTLKVEQRLEALPQDVSFSDVTEANWFYEQVRILASLGVVEGYEDGAFRPNEPATWAMAVAVLTRMGAEDLSAEDPDAPILRIELARLLARTLELPAKDGAPFSDTDDGAVAALAELGVLSGYADGTFRPNEPLTRAELCAAAYSLVMAAVDMMMGTFGQ